MKPKLPSSPPASVVAYELEPGKVLFVQTLPKAPRIEGLSDAEQEVLELLLAGNDTRAISEMRGTSPRTIANQVASLYRKLGVGSRAELAAKILALAAKTS